MGGPGEHATVRDLLDRARAAELVDPAGARSLIQQARSIAHASGDPEGESEALYRLASLSFYAGRPDEAFALAVEARDLALEHGHHLVVAWALNLMGIVHLDAGNYSEALQCCLQSIERYRMTDHRIDEGNILNTMASVYVELGDTDRAIVTYEAALAANRELERPDHDAITLANLAHVRAKRGEYLLAVSLGEQALQLASEHAPSFIPEILTSLGEAYVDIGDPEHGAELLREALDLLALDETGDGDPNPMSRASTLLALGNASRAMGDPAAATEHLDAALELVQLAGLPTLELLVHTALAEVHKQLGGFEAAVRHLEARFEVNQRLFNEGTDLRIRTLQIAHDTEQARQQAEILRLRTTELQQLVDGRTSSIEEFQMQLLDRIVALGAVPTEQRRDDEAAVSRLAGEIALELQLPVAFARQLEVAARLRDIGEVAARVGDGHGDGRREHTLVGASLLEGSSSPPLQLAAELAATHHERWDGSGTPHGASGADIPAAARIVAVAEHYVTLLRREHDPATGEPAVLDALAGIVEQSGRWFDPDVVRALCCILERTHPGAVTALRDAVP